MTPRCFQVLPQDNVATLIDDAPAGPVDLLGPGRAPLRAAQAIPAGHKIALRDVAAGEAIIKYNTRIGHATAPIARGDWVHLHNLASDLDERSGTLDLHSGAPTDTRYE